MARVLSWAAPGDSVSIRNSAERIEPMMVLNPCGQRRTFYCVTCQLPLANAGQIEMHVDPGGTHQLIAWCGRHCTPEGPDPAEVARLARYQQLEAGL